MYQQTLIILHCKEAISIFMEGNIPGKHVMFCLRDDVIWIEARRSMTQCLRLKLQSQMNTQIM